MQKLVKPPHSDSSLVLLDIDGRTRAIRRNDSRSPEGKDSQTRRAGRRAPSVIEPPANHPRGSHVLAWSCRHPPEPPRAPSPLGRGGFSPRASFRSTALSCPFDGNVPLGCTGDRVWASSPQGWAFRDDVQWLYLTGFARVRPRDSRRGRAAAAGQGNLFPESCALRGRRTGGDKGCGVVHVRTRSRRKPAVVAVRAREARRTCWSSGKRGDWYEVDLGMPRKISGFDLFFFDDSPTGECRPPLSFEVKAFQGLHGDWDNITLALAGPKRPVPGENRVRFEPVAATRFRFQFRHAGDRYYTGLYGVRPIREAGEPAPRETSPLQITADKVDHEIRHRWCRSCALQPDERGSDDLCRSDRRPRESAR